MHVHVIRRHDHHRVQIVAFKQLAAIHIGIAALVVSRFDFLTVMFFDNLFRFFPSGPLHFAYGDDAHVILAERLTHDPIRAFPIADESDIEPLVGGRGFQEGRSENRSGGGTC